MKNERRPELCKQSLPPPFQHFRIGTCEDARRDTYMHRAVRSLLAQKTNCMGRPVFFVFFFSFYAGNTGLERKSRRDVRERRGYGG